MPLTIRAPTHADADQLTELVAALNAHENEPTDFATRDAISRDLIGPDRAVDTLLALDGETALGFATFHESYELAYAARGLYMGDLFVTESARGQGIGRALIAEIARIAQARGRTFIWWTAKPSNRNALQFYDSLGAIQEPVMAHAVFEAPFDALTRGR